MIELDHLKLWEFQDAYESHHRPRYQTPHLFFFFDSLYSILFPGIVGSMKIEPAIFTPRACHCVSLDQHAKFAAVRMQSILIAWN